MNRDELIGVVGFTTAILLGLVLLWWRVWAGVLYVLLWLAGSALLTYYMNRKAGGEL